MRHHARPESGDKIRRRKKLPIRRQTMNKIFIAFSIIAAMLLALTACSGKGAEETTAEKTAPLSTSGVIAEPENGAESSTEADELVPENSAVPVYIRIGDTVLTVLPSGNSSADALIALLERGDIALDMRDNGGFEKVAELERSLPTNDIPLAAGPGDLILYNGNTVCLYYGENMYSLTRLGKIQNTDEETLRSLLGDGDVSITFSLTK